MRSTGDGYEYVADDGAYGADERPAYIHRLCVVAWADAETIDGALAEVAGHDVHHEVPDEWLTAAERAARGADKSIPWLNVEPALTPEEWTEHRRRTLAGVGV